MIIEAREGQNVLDVVIQNWGTLENIGDILEDNDDLSLTEQLTAGRELDINTEDEGDEEIKAFFVTGQRTTNNAQAAGVVAGDFNNDYNNDF